MGIVLQGASLEEWGQFGRETCRRPRVREDLGSHFLDQSDGKAWLELSAIRDRDQKS